VTDRRSPAGAALLRLYPRVWRERYESEVLAVLADVAGVAFADELLIRVVSEEPGRANGLTVSPGTRR